MNNISKRYRKYSLNTHSKKNTKRKRRVKNYDFIKENLTKSFKKRDFQNELVFAPDLFFRTRNVRSEKRSVLWYVSIRVTSRDAVMEKRDKRKRGQARKSIG